MYWHNSDEKIIESGLYFLQDDYTEGKYVN